MSRTPLDPTVYMETWKTLDYSAIHAATKAEASRQVNEMVKWMEWQIQYDPEQMKEIHLEAGIFDIIRKARNYRSKIYNRNRTIAQLEFDVIRADVAGEAKAAAEAREKLAVCEDDQWSAARRILKVYCHVKFVAGGSLKVYDAEDVEYEYDPEYS